MSASPLAAPQFEDVWVQVGDQRVYARATKNRATSDRLPVVLVHGLVVAGDYMMPLARYLGRDIPVYVPDLPGFGHSDKPSKTLDVDELAGALAGWMDTAAIPKAHLLGNSFGCQILIHLGMRYPERAASLVLTGPTIDPEARGAIRQTLRWMLDGLHEPPSLGPVLLRDYLSAGLVRALRTFQYSLRDPVEEKLPHVPVPALVVRGGRDTIVPERWARRVYQTLPRGAYAVVPGAGHTVNYNAPLELSRISRLFFERVERAKPTMKDVRP